MSLKTLLGDWYQILEPVTKTQDFKKLEKELFAEYKKSEVVPSGPEVFKAFSLCPPSKLKVVIIGREPYCNGTANGLAFANRDDTVKVSNEIKNINLAIEHDFNTLDLDFDVTLEHWARQGVLLLNSALTVRKNKPGTHLEMWKPVTDLIINLLITRTRNTHFLMWGEHAQSYITDEMELLHFVIKTDYPDYPKDFLTNKQFSKVNNGLEFINLKPIKWT